MGPSPTFMVSPDFCGVPLATCPVRSGSLSSRGAVSTPPGHPQGHHAEGIKVGVRTTPLSHGRGGVSSSLPLITPPASLCTDICTSVSGRSAQPSRDMWGRADNPRRVAVQWYGSQSFRFLTGQLLIMLPLLRCPSLVRQTKAPCRSPRTTPPRTRVSPPRNDLRATNMARALGGGARETDARNGIRGTPFSGVAGTRGA